MMRLFLTACFFTTAMGYGKATTLGEKLPYEQIVRLMPCTEHYLDDHTVTEREHFQHHTFYGAGGIWQVGSVIVPAAAGLSSIAAGPIGIPMAVLGATAAVGSATYHSWKAWGPGWQVRLDRRMYAVVTEAHNFKANEGRTKNFVGFYNTVFSAQEKKIYSMTDVALALDWLDHRHTGLCEVSAYHDYDNHDKTFFHFHREEFVRLAVIEHLDEKLAARHH